MIKKAETTPIVVLIIVAVVAGLAIFSVMGTTPSLTPSVSQQPSRSLLTGAVVVEPPAGPAPLPCTGCLFERDQLVAIVINDTLTAIEKEPRELQMGTFEFLFQLALGILKDTTFAGFSLKIAQAT